MPVRQVFQWQWPPGVEPLWFRDWLATLPENECREGMEAIRRQEHLRQDAIDQGRMILVDNGYVWKDEATANRGKGTDTVWEKYWMRWQKETGVKFIQTLEKEHKGSTMKKISIFLLKMPLIQCLAMKNCFPLYPIKI